MKIGGINTTERCNLSCTMCHFHGPNAPKKRGTLSPEMVLEAMRQIPPQKLWFGGTGDIQMDPHMIENLRNARKLGHDPAILTNAQRLTPELIDELIEIGIWHFRFSVDSIEPEHYEFIRRGGKFDTILEVCAYLRTKKRTYPNIQVEINVTLLDDTFDRQDEFIDFWRGKVDQVNFNTEYDMLKFKKLFYPPSSENRTDCELAVYLLPTGQMVPCCAIQVQQHYQPLNWLPNIKDTSVTEAYEQFQEMYTDPSSPLQQVCQQCEWWVIFQRDDNGNSPYWYSVSLDDGSLQQTGNRIPSRIYNYLHPIKRHITSVFQSFLAML